MSLVKTSSAQKIYIKFWRSRKKRASPKVNKIQQQNIVENSDFILFAVKKAYYKQALKVHPDRVPEEEKEAATEKFKVLAKINEVLNDDSRRALYDEQGVIDDDDDEKFGSTWLEAFKTLFKPITDSDIDNYRKEYVGKLKHKFCHWRHF